MSETLDRAMALLAESNRRQFETESQRLESAERIAEGNRLMVSGSAIGVASVASALLLGATCQMCVVGVPALIGFGIFQRIRGEHLERALARRENERPDGAKERED
jgi:hypothetical protein